MHNKWMVLGVVMTGLGLVAACGDDDEAPADGQAGAGASGGKAGRSGQGGAAGTKSGQAGRSGSSAAGSGARSGASSASGGTGGTEDVSQADKVERGQYLVEHLAACGDCHTPRKSDGSPDESKHLSGVDCFVDADTANPNFGCLSSRNLTNDGTGLKNRTDQEIKDMFMKGERPADSGGKPTALHPVMPYYVLGNMSDDDANAIVAYLRTVPAVEHRVTARQAPFDVDEPAPRFPDSMIPMPAMNYENRAAAMRGRYLAGSIGVCLECHTGRDDKGGILVGKAFQGGNAFVSAELGLPPIFPAMIYSSNITPDATGIKGWTLQNIVDAIKQGKDKRGEALCPPMPAGPMQAFGAISDADAMDMAHYLLSIPARNNTIPAECSTKPPLAEEPDAGADAG
jgi:mono/diheme cytochrome c family protein